MNNHSGSDRWVLRRDVLPAAGLVLVLFAGCKGSPPPDEERPSIGPPGTTEVRVNLHSVGGLDVPEPRSFCDYEVVETAGKYAAGQRGRVTVPKGSLDLLYRCLGNERLQCLLFFDPAGQVVAVGAENKEAVAELNRARQNADQFRPNPLY